MTHRDRQGRQIELTQWADLWESVDEVPGTMFATGTSRDGGERWHNQREDARTEAEAVEQHREVVEDVRRRLGSYTVLKGAGSGCEAGSLAGERVEAVRGCPTFPAA